MLASGTQDRGFAPDLYRTACCGFFLLEKSTACSTLQNKRQIKVQYQDNEAQDTAHTHTHTHTQKKKAVGFFSVRKNPQHAFRRKGSKAVCPVSQICGTKKNPVGLR
jgi:hypothetical protein